MLDLIHNLPDAPSPETSDKYLFIDTKKVVEDMRDLGFEVAGFRRPEFRTRNGAYGLHEVDFRRPQDIGRGHGEAPRVLFLNTYDGSRRAQFVSGIIRFLCMNGLVQGRIDSNEKFLHLGDYQEQLIDYIKEMGRSASKAFDKIEDFRSVTLDRKQYEEMATRAAALRFPSKEDEPAPLTFQPQILLSPRRREDVKADLWTTWNRLQENLLKGGVPGVDTSGNIRTIRPLNQIQKSNDLNRNLWDLLEEYAEQA